MRFNIFFFGEKLYLSSLLQLLNNNSWWWSQLQYFSVNLRDPNAKVNSVPVLEISISNTS